MKKPIKTAIWILAVLAGVPIIYMLGVVVLLSLTEFSPVSESLVQISGHGKLMTPSSREFTLFTWNIGYAGLGKEMDFFYDGGKKTRPERIQTDAYFKGIQQVIKANERADFVLLQEVDICSKRAWYHDEYIGLSSLLSMYCHGFSPNYNCRFVPLPVFEPMGNVKAGLATFSFYKPDEAMSQYYKSDFPWPTRLVMLKRCYMLFRFRLDNGKDLLILNLHNSAYDSTGALRERELTVLDSVLNSEYRKGNYLIAGGDWNSNPRGFKVDMIQQGDSITTIDPPIQDRFLPGWHFVFDTLHPSNRFTDIPYLKGVTRTTIIDFFVVSPNVEIKNITTIATGFAFSDHEPVMMSVRLN
jgi:endonuclease/exonuclease/phosphatase family metal-dependent hydrolase